MGRKAEKNDSLPGSLDMLILTTLTRGNLHGYAIVQAIGFRRLTLAIARVMGPG